MSADELRKGMRDFDVPSLELKKKKGAPATEPSCVVLLESDFI